MGLGVGVSAAIIDEKGGQKDFGDDIYQIESLQRHLVEAAKNNSDFIF